MLVISGAIVPAFVIAPPAAIAIVDPDKIVKVFAVIVKSSAPAISKSIWSSVGEEIVVFPLASKIIASAVLKSLLLFLKLLLHL